jgi:ribosomal protein L15E
MWRDMVRFVVVENRVQVGRGWETRILGGAAGKRVKCGS